MQERGEIVVFKLQCVLALRYSA